MKKAFLGLAACAAMFVLASTIAIADDEAKEMQGSAGCGACCFKAEGGCSSAVKVGDKVYTVKASEKADDATKALIKSLKGAKETINVTIKGVIKENTIIADSVTKKA